ncbi:MAG: CRTAC1 family protein [Acidobacteriota bacterium]
MEASAVPRRAAAETTPARGPRRFLRPLAIALGALLAGTFGTMAYLDAAGRDFYDAGSDTVAWLGAWAEAFEAGDADAFGAFFADEFSGRSLGLTAPAAHSDVDGIRIGRFENGPAVDKAAALEEWRAYRASLTEIDEAAFHLHRFERWDDNERAGVARLEVIAKAAGAERFGIDRALVRFTLKPSAASPSGWGLATAEMVEGRRVAADQAQFVDVAPEAGVDFENQYYPGFFSEDLKFEMLRFGPAGITAVDLNDDGWEDLFIPDGVRSRFFLNARDGSFVDRTAEFGLDGHDGVSVALFFDMDGDGDRDAFISRTFTPNRLLRNDGGRFVDITESSGLKEDCCTTVASVADVDNDGDLDLYVGRYLDPRLAIPTTFYARNGEPNSLYLNDGSGTFRDVTVEAGVGEVGLCLGTVFGDYDNDGDADLYVVNDFGRKTLYRNDGVRNGVPRYTDVTVETGTLAYGAGMSASFGDYDNDGALDIYVAHIRSEHGWFAEWPTVGRYMVNSWRQGVWRSDMPLYFEMFRQSGTDFVGLFQQMASGNTLLRNLGDGTFEDTTWGAEANPPGWFWGSGFIDFDNDGWLDIYAANGWVYGEQDTEIELGFLNSVVSEQDTYKTGAFFDPDNFEGKSWHGHERNRHLRNQGDGTFIEIGRGAGTDLLLNSRGIAVADFWNRGVADIAVAASTDRHALLRNDVGLARDWLGVELRGAASEIDDGTNRDAVGARLVLEHGGLRQTREVVLGDGYGAQNTLRQLFGLGGERGDGAPVVERLSVTWPRSGRTDVYEGFEANRVIAITEGDAEVRPRDPAPSADGPVDAASPDVLDLAQLDAAEGP